MKKESADVIIPDEYLIEIGKVTVQWGLLESVLDLCAVKLAGLDVMDARGAALFAHMTFPLKLDVFSSLCETLVAGHPRLKNYKAALVAVREAQTIRNKVAHAKWFFREEKVYISRITARGKVETSSEILSIDVLRGYSKTIKNAAYEILKLVILSDETLSEIEAAKRTK